MTPSLYLFDDDVARRWFPFSGTRPVGELLFGTRLLRERLERAAGVQTTAYLGPAELEGFQEEGTPPILTWHSSTPAPSSREGQERPGWSPVPPSDGGPTPTVPGRDQPGGGPRIVLSSRYVPPLAGPGSTSLDLPSTIPPEGSRLVVDGTVVGWLLPPDVFLPAPEDLRIPGEREARLQSARPPEAEGSDDTGTRRRASAGTWELPGRVLPDLWTLMTSNARQIRMDLESLGHSRQNTEEAEPTTVESDRFPGVHVLGPGSLTVAGGVVVDAGAVLDLRQGPIYLARGVQIRSGTTLVGPAYIGPDSVLLGGTVGRLSCGPVCKLHGEINTALVNGYSNKAHDGYLGHSILGRWVNLGAMTTNSDLKNTYGTVRVPAPDGDGEVETGLLKVGVFLGDHVRTGIGTLLNTGSMVGPGSNLFGGAMPPRYVPPFSWGTGDRLQAYRKEPFLTTVERVMARRDLKPSSGMVAVFTRLWDRTRGQE